MTIKPVYRIEEVLKTALVSDPYKFKPTTIWKLKDTKGTASAAKKPAAKKKV